MEGFRKWPLLLGAVACIAASVALFVKAPSTDGRAVSALALVLLGAVLLGAFVYSEGAKPNQKREDDDGNPV